MNHPSPCNGNLIIRHYRFELEPDSYATDTLSSFGSASSSPFSFFLVSSIHRHNSILLYACVQLSCDRCGYCVNLTSAPLFFSAFTIRSLSMISIMVSNSPW